MEICNLFTQNTFPDWNSYHVGCEKLPSRVGWTQISGKVYPARSEGAASAGCVRGVARNSRTLAQLGNNCVSGQPLARVDNWFPLIPLSRLPLERHSRTANWRDVYSAPIPKPSLSASFYFQTTGRPGR